MKLVHVVPHIDEEASGPSYSVPRLCETLAARGHDVELSCLAARGVVSGVKVDLHPEWPILGRFAISTSLARALGEKADGVDIVHNHSLWSMVNVAAGCVVPGKRAKLVTSPHGTLSPWALSRSRVAKTMLWPLQLRALARADLLHATSEVEYDDILAQGFTAPVAVIPNGVDLPPLPARKPVPNKRTLLFLSRIHPTKGIDRLLHAWRQLQDAHPDWRLVVAGTGQAEHEHDVRELAIALKLQRVEFPGPLYGKDKSHAYFVANLFVLPTHSENFGMVVAEALAHACPVVVSRGAPWSRLEIQGCGWWVEHDVETLVQSLGAAMRLPQGRLAAMGIKGRNWMEREFGWPNIAERMDSAYEWLLNGGTSPEFVRLVA